MLPSKLRQRRANDPILPHHYHPHGLPPPPPTTTSRSRRKRGSSSRFSWHSNIVVGSICLSITLLAVVMVMWSLSARSSNHHHTKKSNPKSRADTTTHQHHDPHQPQQSNRKFYLLPRKRTDSSKQTWVDCPNGSRGILNDNYCDCSDGSDEPLTSACAHLMPQVPTFPCQDGSGLLLFASRVGDGVQDCGDGSDER